MADVKTKPTKESVTAFLKTIEPRQKRNDSVAILSMFAVATGEKAVMWGTSIVGFGVYHVKSGKSTQMNAWPLVAFSPRKQSLTLYIMSGNEKSHVLWKKLGKYKVSGVCLHIKRLSDVDQTVLGALIKKSFQFSKKAYGRKI